MSKLALENYLFERIVSTVRSVPMQQAHDIYAFYLVLSLDEGGGYRPYIASLAWLTHTDVTPEKARNFGSLWSGWAASGEIVMTLCEEERDPRGFDLQSQFYETLLVDDNARKRWAAFVLAWPYRWNKEMDEPTKARFESMLDEVDVSVEDRRSLFSTMYTLPPYNLSQAFFDVLIQVIQRLHLSGVVIDMCGKAVPVGIMATNDVGYEYGLEPTRKGNPEGLSRGMEEWMMGESYSAIAAREQLEREIAEKPVEEQAKYWSQAALDLNEYFWNNRHSVVIDHLVTCGLVVREENRHIHYLRIRERLLELLPYAAPHLVTLIESRAGNAHDTDWQNKLPENHAEHLLSILESISLKGTREQVPEEVIRRLLNLMHRLWPEYKAMCARKERTGFCLQYVVRVLHALRPERFPRWRQNPRDAGEFNFIDYGLM